MTTSGVPIAYERRQMLIDALRHAEEENARLHDALESARAGEAAALEEVARLRRNLVALSDGYVWIYLGDGCDDIDSMSADMSIAITADDLRLLIAKKLREAFGREAQ